MHLFELEYGCAIAGPLIGVATDFSGQLEAARAELDVTGPPAQREQ